MTNLLVPQLPAAGSVSFPAGSANGATQTVNVAILNDAVSEPTETFSAGLSGVSGGTIGGISTHTVSILDDDPLREHAWAQLMLALYRSGRTAEALQAFCDAQAALRAEYGCDPGPELTEIRRQVAAGSPDLLAGNAGVSSYPAFTPAAGPGAARAL